MIYLYKNNNHIVIKDKPRHLDINGEEKNDLDNFELVSIINWDLDKYLATIKTNLRRWKVLDYDEDTLIYKNRDSVINWFNNHKDTNNFYDTPSIRFVFSTEIKNTFKEFLDTKVVLENMEIIEKVDKHFNEDNYIDKIIYDCDIYNVLEDFYGENYVELVNQYIKLNRTKLIFVLT